MTQRTFPFHRVGFGLVIPQLFNLQKWISILSLILSVSTPEVKVKSMPQLYWNEETWWWYIDDAKYDQLIYFPHCSGDCDWIHPWDTRCDHGHYFPSCWNKRPRLHGQLNSSKTRYCVCWSINAILHTCSVICFLHTHKFSMQFYSFFSFILTVSEPR